MIYKPISKSGISAVRMCPFKADAHKNRGFERVSNIFAERGKEVHKLKQLIDLGQISLAEVKRTTKSAEVAELVENAVKTDPYHGYEDRLCESHVLVDANGRWVDSEDEAAAQGYLDSSIFVPDELIVDDLKTGRSEYDDEDERHLYAGVLAKAAQPHYNKIRFVRHFARSGHRPSWLYEWEHGKDGLVSLFITNPKGERKRVRGKHEFNPMILWLQRILKWIEKTEPKPRPGSHCRNWFGGGPCQFLGNICPISDQLPDIIPQKEIAIPQRDAFLHFFRSKEQEFLHADAATAANALDAVYQLEAGIKDVEKKIKEWANVNGDITLNDELYGWEEKLEPVIDKEVALKSLFDAGLSWQEIAKVVSVSKSSIDKLPKVYQNIKDKILGKFSSQSKRKFGLIRSINVDIEKGE